MEWLRLVFLTLLFMAIAFVLTMPSAEGRVRPTQEIEQAARAASKKYNVDFDLIMSIIHVESAFNPKAVGGSSEVGLMQLHPKFHKEGATFDIKGNIDYAVRYLASLRDRCITLYGRAWFNCYNHGPNREKIEEPTKQTYFNRVITIYKKRTGREYKVANPSYKVLPHVSEK